jgi:hypothetical protein
METNIGGAVRGDVSGPSFEGRAGETWPGFFAPQIRHRFAFGATWPNPQPLRLFNCPAWALRQNGNSFRFDLPVFNLAEPRLQGQRRDVSAKRIDPKKRGVEFYTLAGLAQKCLV